MSESSKVVMYILMRTDLASMTPGRACAQASHAANACIKDLNNENDKFTNILVKEWENEANGFGTTIVLGIDGEFLNGFYDRVCRVCSESPIWAGVVNDPEYSIKDGKVTHLISLNTCGYIFGRKDDCAPLVSHLSLF